MKKQNTTSVGIGVGASSILVVFVILCLTVFSTLTLLQANAYLKSSENYKMNTEQYYETDSLAMDELIKIEKMIENKNCFAEVEQILVNKGYNIDGNMISYSVIINDENKIDVELQINDDYSLEIMKWQQKNTLDDEYQNQGFDF